MAWVLEQFTQGTSNPVAEFLATLTTDNRAKVAALLKQLAEHGNKLKMPKSKALGKNLYELRTRTGVRIFYTFRPGRRAVLLGGIEKKRDDIPAEMLLLMRARLAAIP